jgi:hypothetical protein
VCGHEYQTWSLTKLRTFRATIDTVINQKESEPPTEHMPLASEQPLQDVPRVIQSDLITLSTAYVMTAASNLMALGERDKQGVSWLVIYRAFPGKDPHNVVGRIMVGDGMLSGLALRDLLYKEARRVAPPPPL